MDVEKILFELERPRGYFPHEAVAAAVAQREEITPRLLGVLEDIERDSDPYIDGERMLHIFAMFLLGQFRETRAYAPLVRIFSQPGEFVFDLAGDVVTDYLDRMLASVWGGDITGIDSLIENDEANEYVRAAAIDAHLYLVAAGERTREETLAYFRTLFPRFRRKPTFALDSLVSACADLHPAEVMDHIISVYRDGLVDDGFISRGNVDESLKMGRERAMDDLERKHRLAIDTKKELLHWACFEEPDTLRRPLPPIPPRQQTIRHAQPPPGRNDPCPCGSGKKFKKCCGA